MPAEHQQRVLTFGILVALVMRAIFIALGAALIAAFSFMFLIFGLLLVGTAIQLFRHRDQDPDVQENASSALTRRLIPVTRDLLRRPHVHPRRRPAGRHAFLVTGLLDRLVYLSTGLSLILAFIGVKLLLHYGHLRNDSIPEVATSTSLAVILVVLAVTVVASLLKSRRDPAARAHAGSLEGQSRRAAAAPNGLAACRRRMTRYRQASGRADGAPASLGSLNAGAPGRVTRHRAAGAGVSHGAVRGR